jgi:hypothetical protein
MTAALPNPIELAMPTGDPEALTDVARAAASAARSLTDVDDRLIGAAGAAPGWLGDDAAAAAEQVGRVVDLVRAAADAVLPAADRLRRHAERVLECRRQVEALRVEQQEHFREAQARWAQVENLRMQLMIDGPGVRAIVQDVEAGEGSRRRRHTALLEELEEDAAATARVLADACAVVGGRGAPGDANRVIAYLAAQLPGWGDRELIRRGRALADDLVEGPSLAWETLATDAAAYAGNAAFASALLARLGPERVAQLFGVLGSNAQAPHPSVARLLAAAFGAALPSGRNGRQVAEVLSAVYVHPDDDLFGTSDQVATGMAMVLAAGRSSPTGGPRSSTLAEWARQFLLREHDQGMQAGMGAAPDGVDPEVSDPGFVAISLLADSADPALLAGLLGDGDVWETLLTRFWADGGVALGEVVLAAAGDTGGAGAHAVRTGLEVIGAELVPGDPSDRRVSRATVDRVSRALGSAAAMQVEVVVEALSVGVDGRLGDREDALRGLGYVTLDPAAAAALDRALDDWSRVQPTSLDGTGPLTPLPAVAVPAAFIGVREYGQRLAFALDGFEAQRDAESTETAWNWTYGLLATIAGEAARGVWGPVIDVAAGYAQIFMGADGTWENGVDRGLRFSGDDAAAEVLAALEPQDTAAAEALTRQARAAYERTTTALGTPRPPTSPESDLLAPLVDAAVGGMAGRARDRAEERMREMIRGGSASHVSLFR